MLDIFRNSSINQLIDESEHAIRDRENSRRPPPAIAAAARALIAERGFEGLRTRDIAERVGINVATLHYHVPTKEALIEIVAQSMRDDFIAQSKAWRREGLTPLQELQHEMADFRDTMEHNAGAFRRACRNGRARAPRSEDRRRVAAAAEPIGISRSSTS